jgi:hypothetical protein
MWLTWVIKEDDSFIVYLLLFQKLFSHRYVLDKAVEDIVYDEDIFKGKTTFYVIRTDYFSAQDAEGNCCLFVYYYCIENKLWPGHYLRVLCELG